MIYDASKIADPEIAHIGNDGKIYATNTSDQSPMSGDISLEQVLSLTSIIALARRKVDKYLGDPIKKVLVECE